MITERDRKILYWINRHGFVLVSQVQKAFEMGKTAAYRRLKEMVDRGLLKHERILADIPGVYWVTREGVELCESLLSAGKKPSPSTMLHDIKVIDISVYMLKQYGDVKWLTAREMKSMQLREAQARGENVFSVLGARVPDGVLERNGQYYAIEVELSLKNRQRLKAIIDDYAKRIVQQEFTSVVYFYGKESIAQAIKQEASKKTVAAKFQFQPIPQ